MPIIRNVSWTAENMPDGVTIDKDTGIISGTPANYGSFSVPVTVETDYGSDTKDVGITIICNSNVLARGAQASTWGVEGIDTADGLFRIIPIGDGLRLDTFNNGFGVKMANDDYYACGYYGVNIINQSSQEANKSSKIVSKKPVNLGSDIEQMTGVIESGYAVKTYGSFATGYSLRMSFYFAAERYSNGTGKVGIVFYRVYKYDNATGLLALASSSDWPKDILSNLSDCIALQSDHNGRTFVYVSSSGRAYPRYAPNSSYNIMGDKVYAVPYDSNQSNVFITYMQEVNELVNITNNTGVKINFNSTNGDIKDFWTPNAAFILNTDNELYAKGTSTNGCLGLSPTGGVNNTAVYSDYTKIGEFDVKRIEIYENSTFLLTNNGELYHAGLAEDITGETPHYEFTRVFEDYKFIDIAYSAGTLIAIQES